MKNSIWPGKVILFSFFMSCAGDLYLIGAPDRTWARFLTLQAAVFITMAACQEPIIRSLTYSRSSFMGCKFRMSGESKVMIAANPLIIQAAIVTLGRRNPRIRQENMTANS
jgi:hypothetical protein